MVFSAVATSDFDTGALIFIVSLVAPSRTLRFCFTASFHCVSISKICLAAYWFFLIFIELSSSLFFLYLCAYRWFFSFKVGRSGVEVMFLIFILIVFCTSRGCILSLVHCQCLQYPGCYSRGWSEFFNINPHLEVWRT